MAADKFFDSNFVERRTSVYSGWKYSNIKNQLQYPQLKIYPGGFELGVLHLGKKNRSTSDRFKSES